MKKNVIFAVAIAALAFVGCNKEEHNGQVALNLAGEAFTSTEKQAFQNNTQLLFSAGDQAYVNGVIADLGVRSSGRTATLWVTPSENGYAVNYPANVLSVDENGAVTTTFANEVTLVPATNTTTQMVAGTHQVWPMSGFSMRSDTSNFKLYNNVAVLAPAVKYGAAWAESMWGANGMFPIEGFVADADNLPTLTITKVVFQSTNMALCGPAHLVNNTEEYNPDDDLTGGFNGPHFVCDRTPSASNPSRVECTIAGGGVQAVPTTSTTAGIVTVTFGNLAVPQCQNNNKNLTVYYYFSANINGQVHNYRYHNTITTNAGFRLKRGFRSTVIVNFYTPNTGTTIEL